MNYKKIINNVIYGISIIILVVLTLNLYSNNIFRGDELGEKIGTLLAILLGFQLLIYFNIKLIKIKNIDADFKKLIIKSTAFMRDYHYSVGALMLSLLFFHLSLTIDLNNLMRFNFVTGYMISFFVILSVMCGLATKLNRKLMRLLHIILAFTALIPLLIHIAD